MSSLRLQKRLAAGVMKCGKNKVRWGTAGYVRSELVRFLILVIPRPNVSKKKLEQ